MKAVRSGDCDLVKKELEELQDAGELEKIVGKGDTLLHLAASSNSTAEITESILKYKDFRKIINQPSTKGSPALILAANNDAYEIIRLLLINHADPDVRDKSHKTAVHFAAMHGYYHSLSILLYHGANPTLLDKRGRPPLTYCCFGFSKNWHETNLLPEPNPFYIDESVTNSPVFRQVIIPTYRDMSPRISFESPSDSQSTTHFLSSVNDQQDCTKKNVDFERCFLLLDRAIGTRRASKNNLHETWFDYDDFDHHLPLKGNEQDYENSPLKKQPQKLLFGCYDCSLIQKDDSLSSSLWDDFWRRFYIVPVHPYQQQTLLPFLPTKMYHNVPVVKYKLSNTTSTHTTAKEQQGGVIVCSLFVVCFLPEEKER